MMNKVIKMKKQDGVVLIVSLLILLVTTLLGVTAMQGTNLEMKMANNTAQRLRVFHAAEAALKRAENAILQRDFSSADLNSATCAASENRSDCFDSDCTGGYCFFGTNSAYRQADCEVSSGTTAIYPVWHKNNTLKVWNDDNKNLTLAVIDTNGFETSFQYIVEFQCFVDGRAGDVKLERGDALFRITLLAEGLNGSIKVMLQSTYGLVI